MLEVVMDEAAPASILIVGDNPDFCYLMQRYAQQSLHRTLSAFRNEDILALAHREKPAAIVLEVGLPGTAGWTLLSALKRDPSTNRIPVVLCSWLEDEDLGLNQGADVYLRKPVLYEQFLEALGVVGIDPRAGAV
jgi:chemotaxis family two-component system response regulator PixH